MFIVTMFNYFVVPANDTFMPTLVLSCLVKYFFVPANVYALRVNLSVAIVAMVTNHTTLASDGTEITVSNMKIQASGACRKHFQ